MKTITINAVAIAFVGTHKSAGQSFNTLRDWTVQWCKERNIVDGNLTPVEMDTLEKDLKQMGSLTVDGITLKDVVAFRSAKSVILKQLKEKRKIAGKAKSDMDKEIKEAKAGSAGNTGKGKDKAETAKPINLDDVAPEVLAKALVSAMLKSGISSQEIGTQALILIRKVVKN